MGMSLAVAQGGVVPPQNFGVVNLGTGSLAWTASVSTLSGGNWLRATPSGGSSDASVAAPQVVVSVNPGGLAAGDYYGLVQIAAPGAANTPQLVSVFLTVLPAGSDPGASVQPAELFFQATTGTGSPGSQEVLVYNIGAAPQTFSIGFQSNVYITNNAPVSFAVLPDSETLLDPSRPTPVVMQPFGPPIPFSGYANFQFSDGRVQTVKVNVIVPPAISGAGKGGAAVSGTKGDLRLQDAATGCVPTTLIPALTTLGQAFAVSAGSPVALSVDVKDDCGNPQTSGSVTVGFSTGDPPMALSSLNNGTWQGTWATAKSGAGQVSLSVTAVNNQLQISGRRDVQGGIGSPKTPPAITQAGILSAASPASYTALAPGSIIAIYGDLLADDAASAQTLPLPTTLGNASVIIGGQIVPLFYASPGQVNALVPYGLNNKTNQLLIQRGTTLSQPVPVNIADAQPGVFQSGGSALAFDSRGTAPAFLVTPSSPARADDVLVFYCGGLGVPDQPVADGSASP